MKSNIDIHTELLLAHGSVPMQPQLALALNAAPTVAFRALGENIGLDPAGYKVRLTGYAQAVSAKEKQQSTSTFRRLQALLISLRSAPRSPDAKNLKGSVSTFKLENDFFRVDYRIFNGEVTVYNIQPVDKIQKMRDRQEKAALYSVKRNGQGIWQLGAKVASVNTPHAAVNGQSNNLNKAVWLMGQHLNYQFNGLQEYTLFHNPSDGGTSDTWESMRDKFGITTPVTKQFARILEDAQKRGNSTAWVAHSQGGVIFAEGVRYLLNGGSGSPLNKLQLNGLRNPEKGSLLDKQSVAFHSNANNNIRSSVLFKRAGIAVLQGQTTDYDFVRNIIGFNTLNPRKLIGSVIYGNHVFSGSVTQSPHTLAQTQEQWLQNMLNSPGKGRGPVQKLFNIIDKNKVAVKTTPNYLP